jgi:hypothetical protein
MLLPITVTPTYPLLDALGIPGQVVIHNHRAKL